MLNVKNNNVKRTKEEAQKEMLDTELDIITKQQEGADTTELQKKLLELRARVGMTRGRGRGRRYNPIVNRQLLTKNNLIDNNCKCCVFLFIIVQEVLMFSLVALKGNIKSASSPNKNVFQKHTVDHRPTRILVSGYEGDEQESVLQHFGVCLETKKNIMCMCIIVFFLFVCSNLVKSLIM